MPQAQDQRVFGKAEGAKSAAPATGGGGGAAFPVKVEAIVAFVLNPNEAYRAITRHVSEYGHTGDAEEFNEGVKFSFSYGGLRHDVTITNETPA